MTDFKCILFLCNWGPHAAYQTLQDRAARIPREINMVRIPCTGRISKALLFKPFEMGADGVALVGCEPGNCRYGSGTVTARENVADTRGVLELLGLGKERLRLATFMPEDSDGMAEFLQEFVEDIKAIGTSPVSSDDHLEAPPEDRPARLHQLLAGHDIYACQDCGKCSSACSLALAGKPYSPRAMARALISGDMDSTPVRHDIWSCLTCGVCYERCPSAVNFPEFIRDMRTFLKETGHDDAAVHGGFFHSVMRTMTEDTLEVKRWRAIPPDIKTDPGSGKVFFGGCSPYFDLFFRTHLGVRTETLLEQALRLLNFFDIFPAVLEKERCCGHDLLWSGDRRHFMELAEMNAAVLKTHGVEELITACPECYRTLSRDYPAHGIDMGIKITHILDLIEGEIDKGAVGFKAFEGTMTFQDPCRLSRFEGKADLPRKLIGRLCPDGFREMRDSGENAICCGNTAWSGCDAYTKGLQVKRLGQARETGSDLLITACPKCMIHLSCAMEDPFQWDDVSMEIRDLTDILAENIQWD